MKTVPHSHDPFKFVVKLLTAEELLHGSKKMKIGGQINTFNCCTTRLVHVYVAQFMKNCRDIVGKFCPPIIQLELDTLRFPFVWTHEEVPL